MGNHDGPRLCPLLSSGPRRSGLLLHPPHPPIYGKQTEPRRGREPWWRSLSRQTGAGTAGTQTQGPVPNPEGQRQPCLTAWAFIHSPWLREAAGSNTGGALPGVILTPCAKDGSSGSSQVVGVGGSRDSTSPAPGEAAQWSHGPDINALLFQGGYGRSEPLAILPKVTDSWRKARVQLAPRPSQRPLTARPRPPAAR